MVFWAWGTLGQSSQVGLDDPITRAPVTPLLVAASHPQPGTRQPTFLGAFVLLDKYLARPVHPPKALNGAALEELEQRQHPWLSGSETTRRASLSAADQTHPPGQTRHARLLRTDRARPSKPATTSHLINIPSQIGSASGHQCPVPAASTAATSCSNSLQIQPCLPFSPVFFLSDARYDAPGHGSSASLTHGTYT